jgi:hypothetical protein
MQGAHMPLCRRMFAWPQVCMAGTCRSRSATSGAQCSRGCTPAQSSIRCCRVLSFRYAVDSQFTCGIHSCTDDLHAYCIAAGRYPCDQLAARVCVQAGRQGSKRQGEVFVPKDSQQPNPELLQGASYRLPHMRPGEQPLRREAVLRWQWLSLCPQVDEAIHAQTLQNTASRALQYCSAC